MFLFIGKSYIFFCYFVHHGKSSIFKPAFITGPIHATNIRFVSQYVRDETYRPALDHFELIVGIPEKSKHIQVIVQLEEINSLVPLRRSN